MLSVSRRVAYIPLVGLLLSACGSQAAPAPGSPEAAIQPIAAVPTAAPRPTDTPVPAPTPTATPKPEPRSPLTGLPASQADMARRPLLVKIGNSEAERPQSGLSLADVVYESVTEGGITRYAAVFQSQETGTIGPVRSARLSDLQIAPEFDAVLAHVGASSPVMDLLHASSLLDLDQFFNLQYYHRTTDRVAPYNVYTSTASLRAGALAHGFAPTAEVAPYVFEDTAHDGVSAGSIDFDFAKQTHVRYVYDVAQHDYHQMEYDAATIDAATRKPVNIKNLVVQLTPVQTTDIVEDGNGSHSLEYDLVGSGEALVFHDGAEIRGKWSRGGLDGRTSFVDESGKPIPFARGATWIAIVQPDTSVLVQPILPATSA